MQEVMLYYHSGAFWSGNIYMYEEADMLLWPLCVGEEGEYQIQIQPSQLQHTTP